MILHDYSRKYPETLELTKATVLKGAGLKPLTATFGAVTMITLVYQLIQNYCNQFNVGRNMTQSQIEDLAADIVLDAKKRPGTDITLEELTVFFDRAAKGEFVRNGKKLVPFDRIDRGLIEDILDFYFETDRTVAVWNLQDERDNAQRLKFEEPQTEPEQRSAPADEPKSIDELIKGKSHLTAKGLKELHERYGK